MDSNVKLILRVLGLGLMFATGLTALIAFLIFVVWAANGIPFLAIIFLVVVGVFALLVYRGGRGVEEPSCAGRKTGREDSTGTMWMPRSTSEMDSGTIYHLGYLDGSRVSVIKTRMGYLAIAQRILPMTEEIKSVNAQEVYDTRIKRTLTYIGAIKRAHILRNQMVLGYPE